MHGHDGVAGVVASREQSLLLELGEPRLDTHALSGELRRDRLVLDGELFERLEVVEVRLERAERVELALQAGVLGGDRRGAVLVVPESAGTHLLLERG